MNLCIMVKAYKLTFEGGSEESMHNWGNAEYTCGIAKEESDKVIEMQTRVNRHSQISC